MADYNPDAGIILGQEWVPIVSEPATLAPTQEIGWGFDLPSAEVVSSGRVYIFEPPVDSGVQVGDEIDRSYVMMAIYPRGTEDHTGPMRETFVEISGGSIASSPNMSVVGAASVRDALYYPDRGSYVDYTNTSSTGEQHLAMQFNFTGHPELIGKRIARFDFVYSLGINAAFQTSCIANIGHYYGTAPPPGPVTGAALLVNSAEVLAGAGANFDTFPTVQLPNLNVMYETPGVRLTDVAAGTPYPCYPWTKQRLDLLDLAAGANAQCFAVDISLPIAAATVVQLQLYYAALRVVYCEEQRVVFGGLCMEIQANSMQPDMRSPALNTDDGLIAPGEYTLTLEGGTLATEVFAVRELYEIPGPGLVIDHTDRIGDSFEASSTDHMVMASLHQIDGDTIIGPHAYGDQEQGDVVAWPDSTLSRQLITNSTGGGTFNYPVARFYARRYGETSGALTLTNTTTPAITASITVAEFDLLPEIADGWKQVDLTFTAPLPSFDNTGTQDEWYWSSPTPAGAPWQVMVASAFSRNNAIPSVPYSGSTAPDVNTYGGIAAFATVNAVNEPSMDYTLLFAQEMPEVTDLEVGIDALAVTGIGQDCDQDPEGIPTAILFHFLQWTALTPAQMPAEGFGYYELQRSDDVDDWATILIGTAPLVTSFADYEARVGMEARYRIRFVHRLLFPSAWSATVTSTIPAPGVLGDNVDEGVLIFTTNERQTGLRSLAYAMQWNGVPLEDFTFVEAADRKLEKMYNRDYQVAFRPLERGGQAFSRTLLLQKAAVPDGLIQYGFTSLRDLAWDTVSYVAVRDEHGDKWLANVNVPTGTIRDDQTIYLAQVDITEVTATPSVVVLPSATQGDPGTGTDTCTPALWDGLPGWDFGCWSA